MFYTRKYYYDSVTAQRMLNNKIQILKNVLTLYIQFIILECIYFYLIYIYIKKFVSI